MKYLRSYARWYLRTYRRFGLDGDRGLALVAVTMWATVLAAYPPWH